MGVSGSGKTTIGEQLAKKLELPYYDADDFHPQTNIDKMKSGLPLNDNDRKPWLLTLAKELSLWEQKKGAVLACSALKETYRTLLMSQSKKIEWVYLSGTFNVIKSRLESRAGHFMKSDLLQSQFDALEVPNYGIHVTIDNTPLQIINTITEKLKHNE